ncbi:TetR/AcrR family transcriptional regulator [Yinghuangia soli]|uniref:TetR/AcrR family transcriptional regulator n=1 Tax=Yinghuangia soli TaxID=2908204 RepID=A0AA41TZ52_9ACTN|nr:helix-turn-helix domain-containing protein [Yinghuangia soli]MCF2528478.1 TetR/AcrR family transcriptional regulator [Yinghuangia soli]
MSSSPASNPPAAPVRTKRVGRQLTPDQIVEASLRIAARGSADAFTIRRLGDELGSDPTAIYRHFRDKDELMLTVADRMHGEVLDNVPDGLDWRDRLRALAAAAHAAAVKYPIVASSTASRTTRRVNEFRIVELILGALAEAGLDGADAALYYRVVGDSMLAYTGQYAAYLLVEPGVRASDEASWSGEYRLADTARFPHITRLGDELPAITHEAIYEARFEALIIAIEHLAAERRAAAGDAGTAS